VRHDLLEGNRRGGRRSPWRAGGGGSLWNATSPVVGNNEGGGHENEDTWLRWCASLGTKGVLDAFYGRWHRGEGRGGPAMVALCGGGEGGTGTARTRAGGGWRQQPRCDVVGRRTCTVRAGDLEKGVSDGWGPGYSAGQRGQTWVKRFKQI
jgi:hypothetical protein